MKPTTSNLKYTLASLVLLFACLINTRAQEIEDEREFSYAPGSENGPDHWGELHSEWRECNSERMQSPIDLLNERVEVVSHLGRLERHYKKSNGTLVNRGHDMMLRWTDDAGHVLINGIQYHFRQCHWHSPSEHTISGRRFDMELHMVHESNDSRIAVIGVLYKIGLPDSLLSMMNSNLETVAHVRDMETSVGVIDPKLIRFGSRKYYRYIGSLTTPPCTQNVIWTIVRKVRTVSREQLHVIREAVHDGSEVNARPTQQLNDRTVKLYRPSNPEK